MLKQGLSLKNFTFSELFTAKGLTRLDHAFLATLPDELSNKLLAYRKHTLDLTHLEISEFILAVSPYLEKFLVDLFDIEEAAEQAKARTLSHNPIAAFKKYYVLRRAKKQVAKSQDLPSFETLDGWLEQQLNKAPLQTKDRELAVALLGNGYLTEAEKYTQEIDQLANWCTQAIATTAGQIAVKQWSSFIIPERIDHHDLVKTTCDADQRLQTKDADLRLRDGFALTDPRMNAREVQDQVNYCIYCHDHDGDFCSKGFPVKKGDPEQGFKKNSLDIILTGCPLEEKISEMNILKRDGYTLASLAVVMIDNPMCPATGHRICNDCMKACIYQKQDPVNIPQIETRVLTDVLHLPWGVEIYDLLTRWNPLRKDQPVMKPYNGLKVMIAGMGPAGFTLAHHLLLEGFAVVGFDGLKIEPLPSHLIHEPIYQFNQLIESLDERLMSGFGGVAEYGITVRWDKNFLKLIYISLMRKPYFQVFGSTRFGGTICVEDAFEMGFDHFAIAVGAGLPKALSIPGSLAPGMRQANDFLMALQLGNAAKKTSLTNLQIRLPAVIIGGGLTGVDTATEVQAYYITQVEKILSRYETLTAEYSETYVLNGLDDASKLILQEFLTHGKAVREERQRAKEKNQKPNFIKLIRAWGGVTIAYRRTLQESPAYQNNHEELQKAFQEGIYYLECLEPSAVELDEFGHSKNLICTRRIRNDNNEWLSTSDEVILPAHSIFVATGTQPNIAYEFEHRGTFTRLGFQYQHYEDDDGQLSIAHGVEHCKDPQFGPFTSYHKDDHRVSLIGDTHPVFHGNVVKAIASGLRTYPKILKLFEDRLTSPQDEKEYHSFAEKMRHWFTNQVVNITHPTPLVTELTIKAPLCAKHFQPGQFFRLQNYESFARRIDDTVLQMEPLALVCAEVNSEDETLKFIVIKNGVSTKLCDTLKIGEPVSLMGPTGVRAKISHEHETVLIVGSQLSLALLQSYGKALKKAGNTVLFAGHFTSPAEVYNQSVIETLTDRIIWTTQGSDKIKPGRTSDYSTEGNIIDALVHLAKQPDDFGLANVDRIYIIGNSHLLRDFAAAREQQLKAIFLKNPPTYGSVYSTMQCMLKGVCAQCLQWQIDPETGKRTKAVFACSWPEQPLELIDFDNIEERQVQNHLQEHISNLWVDYLLR